MNIDITSDFSKYQKTTKGRIVEGRSNFQRSIADYYRWLLREQLKGRSAHDSFVTSSLKELINNAKVEGGDNLERLQKFLYSHFKESHEEEALKITDIIDFKDLEWVFENKDEFVNIKRVFRNKNQTKEPKETTLHEISLLFDLSFKRWDEFVTIEDKKALDLYNQGRQRIEQRQGNLFLGNQDSVENGPNNSQQVQNSIEPKAKNKKVRISKIAVGLIGLMVVFTISFVVYKIHDGNFDSDSKETLKDKTALPPYLLAEELFKNSIPTSHLNNEVLLKHNANISKSGRVGLEVQNYRNFPIYPDKIFPVIEKVIEYGESSDDRYPISHESDYVLSKDISVQYSFKDIVNNGFYIPATTLFTLTLTLSGEPEMQDHQVHLYFQFEYTDDNGERYKAKTQSLIYNF